CCGADRGGCGDDPLESEGVMGLFGDIGHFFEGVGHKVVQICEDSARGLADLVSSFTTGKPFEEGLVDGLHLTAANAPAQAMAPGDLVKAITEGCGTGSWQEAHD